MKTLKVRANAVTVSWTVFTLCVLSWNAAAENRQDAEPVAKGTCRIHIQETFKRTESTVFKRIKFSEVPQSTRQDCKAEAMNRKIASSSKEDVLAVKASFGFKEASLGE